MFVDQNNPLSRPTGTYHKVITEIAKDGVCPFCPEHLAKYHKNPISEKQFWLITDNMYPYKPAHHHLLFIHKKHINHLSEIPKESWDELQLISKEEIKKRNIVGGTLIIRFGETRYTGASVTHLHAHLVQSNPDDATYDAKKGLTMRIG